MVIATTDDQFAVQVRRPEKFQPQAVGVITVGTLAPRYTVPHRDSKKKKGYQRPVSQARVNRLVKDLEGGQVDIPTAVLLNLRDYNEEQHILEEKNGIALFSPDGSPLYVVDGQHRIAALAQVYEKDPERWKDYPLNFVCMLGADEREEMRQFYIVNSTAKSVRTDLALDLLKQQAENDPNIMDALVERGEDWKVHAQTLTEKLDQVPVWSGRIRFPGDPKAETTLGSAGMAGSLKQLLATPYLSAISNENQVKILEAYWEGIALVIPEVFGRAGADGTPPGSPNDYVIQKGAGVMIMHQLLIPVIELLRSKGESVLEAQSYADVLRDPLLELEGDTAEGTVARGADFWLSGRHGAAGSFSSNAGRRVLAARLKSNLPDIEVE